MSTTAERSSLPVAPEPYSLPRQARAGAPLSTKEMHKTAGRRIKVLLTVPHLVATASPYRETMAIAKYLPQDEFRLSVCVLRPAGVEEAAPVLAGFGVSTFVARFRPTSRTLRGIAWAMVDQRHLLAHGRCDIQHSLDFTSSPFEGVCARLMGRSFLYTQRNLNEDGHPLLLRIKIGVSGAVIAISDVTEALVRDMSVRTTPVTTIPLGFDFSELSPEPTWSPSTHPSVILSVGHLQRRKRVEDAIRAVALVRKTVPGTELWIIGRTYDQSYKSDLTELAGQLGLSDAVKFLGVREDVVGLMSRASALLHCADSEAFGWSVLEAMAVGLPVVACDSGGPSELIEHGETGLLATIGDYETCSRHIRAILADPSIGRRLSGAASAKARDIYTAQKFAREHAALYRFLARGVGPEPG